HGTVEGEDRGLEGAPRKFERARLRDRARVERQPPLLQDLPVLRVAPALDPLALPERAAEVTRVPEEAAEVRVGPAPGGGERRLRELVEDEDGKEERDRPAPQRAEDEEDAVLRGEEDAPRRVAAADAEAEARRPRQVIDHRLGHRPEAPGRD